MFAKEPCVHVTVGVIVLSALSVAVSVDATVAPEATSSRVSGVKAKTGGSVSGTVIVTVSVAVPEFPAASVAAAVHWAMVSTSTSGAV